MIEKEVIKDQKETIHRLQEECKENVRIINRLVEEVERLKVENSNLDKKSYTDSEIVNNINERLQRYKEALRQIEFIYLYRNDMLEDRGDFYAITGGETAEMKLHRVHDIITRVLKDEVLDGSNTDSPIC